MTLPRGPWRSTVRDGITNADGNEIVHRDGDLAPEVARAICALPALIEAAREMPGLVFPPALPDGWLGQFNSSLAKLRAALRIVDGEG
jgi:hypothetical protein